VSAGNRLAHGVFSVTLFTKRKAWEQIWWMFSGASDPNRKLLDRRLGRHHRNATFIATERSIADEIDRAATLFIPACQVISIRG
jgi:hypothetical protein